MKNKSYFKVAAALSLVLAITILLWSAAPVMLCYAQGYGYGGGGGGGGGVFEPYPGVTILTGNIDGNGVMTGDVIAGSFDECCWLTIKRGTKVLNKFGHAVSLITMLKLDSPPPLPEGSNSIGIYRDHGPSGATFEPCATLTCCYDEELLPEGFDENNLVIAMWDKATGKWVILGSTVDTEKDEVSAQVCHFTPFAILAGTAPTAFTVTDLAIAPGEVVIGGEVTISVLVNNTGYLSGSYEVVLKIDDKVVATEEVTVRGLAKKKVTFTVARKVVSTYTVDVNGLTGTFEVSAAPPPPAPPPPAPTPVPPINWYLIGGIVAGCIILGVIIWQVVRRRGAV